MIKNIFQVIVLSGLLVINACNPEAVDVTPPTMAVNSFTPAPGAAEVCGEEEPEVFQLIGGDQLSFDVFFEDDDALSQFKVDIHNNFDCHGHGGGIAPKVAAPDVVGKTTTLSVLQIKDLSGASANVTEVIDIPENVTTGNYHFQIRAVDVSGNPLSNIFSLKIKNPLDDVAPEINIQEPAMRNFSVKKGETIRFAGEVTDNRSLSDGGNGVLFLAYTDLSSGNTFATDKVVVFDEKIENRADFDFEYTLPQTLVAGNYRFSIGANDGVRNVAEFQFFELEIMN